MNSSQLNWDRIPSKIKKAIEYSLEHLEEKKFVLNETNFEQFDDLTWDLLTCYLKQLLHLNFAFNKFIKLPARISALTHLQTLNLTKNQLEHLPDSIVSLSQLRILKLSQNKLVDLPSNFGSLKSLEILDLTGNRLNSTIFTNDFLRLNRLRALYLGDNLFEKFVEENVENFPNLQILVLRHNRIRQISPQLIKLTQLKELHIQQNQIEVLPPVFGKFDLNNPKHIYRFEPNPFVPELALQMNHFGRLANFLTSEIYREIYQNFFLRFDEESPKKSSKLH